MVAALDLVDTSQTLEMESLVLTAAAMEKSSESIPSFPGGCSAHLPLRGPEGVVTHFCSLNAFPGHSADQSPPLASSAHPFSEGTSYNSLAYVFLVTVTHLHACLRFHPPWLIWSLVLKPFQ